MGGKHGKYVYVKRRDGWYVKVRVMKGRDESDPARYIVVGPKVRAAPFTFEVLGEDELPEEVLASLYSI